MPRAFNSGEGGVMKSVMVGMALGAMLGTGALAQTQQELTRDGNGGSTDNVLTYGMGYHQQRYSPLQDINKQTVGKLVPVWSMSMNNDVGEQAQPIVYNGVMYVTNVKRTIAIDIKSGRALWT